jgi:integrase
MAKPYKDGAAWAYRLRVAGQDVYRSGFKTEAKARADMERLKIELTNGPQQAGLGPHRTTLGVAFLDYARERLPYLKGAVQDSRRINCYLRALRLPIIQLTPVEVKTAGQRVYWNVSLVEERGRAIPASLEKHRIRQSDESSESEQARKRLAMKLMADITTGDIQKLINALRGEGKKSATVHLERSELRRLFKHASAVWCWKHAGGNPAGAELDMPPTDDGRKRVLTNEEWQRLSTELASYPNPYALPLACLMLETAMRSCEPLVLMRWSHVDWKRRVITLPDGKAGAREVPLNAGALHVLWQLKHHANVPTMPDDKVFPTTYEAVKKAWAVACEKAGVAGVGLHDLRHTSATRHSLEHKGDVATLKVITGHKTVDMVMRYVNVTASEVATLMHNEPLDVPYTAAGYQMSVTTALDAALEARSQGGVRRTKGVGHAATCANSVSFAMQDVQRVEPDARKPHSAPVEMTTSRPQSNVVVVNFRRGRA